MATSRTSSCARMTPSSPMPLVSSTPKSMSSARMRMMAVGCAASMQRNRPTVINARTVMERGHPCGMAQRRARQGPTPLAYTPQACNPSIMPMYARSGPMGMW
eukprot:10382180-Alexandrium_andersonii.AAC.1